MPCASMGILCPRLIIEAQIKWASNRTMLWSRTDETKGGGLGRWVWLTSILATAGVLLVARRRWFPRQQEVVGSLLPLLRSVPEVRALVGSNLTPGGVTKVTRHYWGRSLRQWNKRSVEVCVLVRGEVSRCSVCVSAVRSRGRVILDPVCVSLPNQETLRL